jgi:hypothetical protein
MTRLAVFLLACAFLTGCVDTPPEPPTSTAQPVPQASLPVSNSLGVPEAPPSADEPAWQRLAEELEGENRQLAAERDYWKGEAARYQAGLDRAVAELNRVASAAAAAQQQARPSARSRAAQPWAGTPWIKAIGDQLHVTVQVYNWDDADATGNVEVELLADNEVVDSRTESMMVPARSSAPLTAVFRHPARTATTYSARVRLDY